MTRVADFFVLVFWQITVLGQTTHIQGVVNHYQPVNGISGYEIEIGRTDSFSVGDKVLIIQMQGATINETNTSGFGDITDIGNAGNYEFTEICQILSPNKILVKDLQRAYDVNGKVQVIRIPVYQNAVVDDTLKALAWDGNIGGIISIECSGNLSMRAPITAKGKGFRGGQTTTSDYECVWFVNNTRYHYNITSGEGAEKGEGIAQFIVGKTAGRGAQANGGGGGNDHNSGGGGGGNATAGGAGGNRIRSSAFTCNSVAPGVGGKALPYNTTLNKVFMGGGGGAGHEDNTATGSNGSNGGGIVIIKADTLIANANSIHAEGASTDSIAGDGGGGGGAGGSVLMDVNVYKGIVEVDVSGGDGGNIDNLTNVSCNGPGGAGSGGIIWFSNSAKPSGINPFLDGGSSGRTLRTGQSNCTIDGTNGAENGNNGLVMFNLSLPQLKSIPITKEDYTLCAGDSVLVAGSWQKTSGTYLDTLITRCRDSVIEKNVQFLPAKTGNFTGQLCRGESIRINGKVYDSSVVDALEVFKNIGPLGCDSTVTVNITQVVIDTSVQSTPPHFMAHAIDAQYQWFDCRLNKVISGATNRNFTASQAGQYAVIITQNNCSDTSKCLAVNRNQLNPKFMLYPNPSVQDFTIDLGVKKAFAYVYIYDLVGQKIETHYFTDSRFLSVSFDKATAMYLISVETPERRTTFKWIKE